MYSGTRVMTSNRSLHTVLDGYCYCIKYYLIVILRTSTYTHVLSAESAYLMYIFYILYCLLFRILFGVCFDYVYFYDVYVKKEWDLITLRAVKLLLILLVTGKSDNGLKHKPKLVAALYCKLCMMVLQIYSERQSFTPWTNSCRQLQFCMFQFLCLRQTGSGWVAGRHSLLLACVRQY